MIGRSPFFYVGDKYKLLPQILESFPEKMNNFYEPFAGGGSVFLNVEAKQYLINDVDKHLICIHKMLMSYAKKEKVFFGSILDLIDRFKLSKSFVKDIVPSSLKEQFKKTYFAQFNKKGYLELRAEINREKSKDPLKLYVALIYGFNRMLRFNKNGDFNLPVGNVDFNLNVQKALINYFDKSSKRIIKFSSYDYYDFINMNHFVKDDFVYFDPPYLITGSEYNKLWNEEQETRLLELIDELNKRNIKFALSNVISYQGKKNKILMNWMKNFNVKEIKSNYINYHHNKQKDIKEILITNY